MVLSTPPDQSALAIAANPDFDAGMNTLRALKPLTPPECSRYSVGPRSRIDWPQPYGLERPSLSGRGVVIVFHDAGDNTLPSISARSHASRSDGVDQNPACCANPSFAFGNRRLRRTESKRRVAFGQARLTALGFVARMRQPERLEDAASSATAIGSPPAFSTICPSSR